MASRNFGDVKAAAVKRESDRERRHHRPAQPAEQARRRAGTGKPPRRRHYCASDAPRPRRRGDRVRRGAFITLLGGVAFVECSGCAGSRSAAFARAITHTRSRLAISCSARWRASKREWIAAFLSELPAESPDQSAPLQHVRRARRCTLDCTLLRRFCCALSRRHHDQLGALEPGLDIARPFWRSKELRTRQSLHDLPPVVGSGQPTTTRFYF